MEHTLPASLSATRRKRGRPRSIRPTAQGATDAHEALINAAITHFAIKGFAGARVDEIAAQANVNKQLLYHYFSNKQGLYLAALETVYARIRTEEQRLSLAALSPREAMEQLVGFSFDYLLAHPEFIALLVDENRNHGRHILASERLHNMHSPLIDMLQTTLARGVHAGIFHPDYDAIDLYISIAGVSYFFFSNIHTLSVIFDRRFHTPDAHASRRAHVIAFVLNALRP